MSDSPFFDTNVLIYALDAENKRGAAAQNLLASGGTISVQCLNEFVAVVRRKLRMGWNDVRDALAAIEALCPSPRPITPETHKRALRIAERLGYQIYDSLILASALEARCTTLYSEDLQDGQVVEGMTIRNPFAAV